jgi:hypothetical protein
MTSTSHHRYFKRALTPAVAARLLTGGRCPACRGTAYAGEQVSHPGHSTTCPSSESAPSSSTATTSPAATPRARRHPPVVKVPPR